MAEPGTAPDHEAAPPGSLVVGHDGSAGAQHALAVALELAAGLGTPLVVVRSWTLTTAPRPAGWTFGYVSPPDELRQAVLDELVGVTEGTCQSFPAVEVSYLAPQGGASQRLIDLSREARMLVVGSRGLGGFAELVLGSTSDQCVRYARCPVLVVKNLRRAERGGQVRTVARTPDGAGPSTFWTEHRLTTGLGRS